MLPLSPSELFDVTGKRHVAAQAAVLAKLGVPFEFLGRSIKVDRIVVASLLAQPVKPSKPTFDDLPDAAYVRQSQLIPSPLPWSSATLWRKCKRGDFVSPVKLSERVTAWNVGEVRRWLAEQAAK